MSARVIDLTALAVLVVDCQATGANPQQGALIEIGWARADGHGWARRRLPVETRVLRLPPDGRIPARVQRVTGIEPEDIAAGHEPAEVWREILSIAAVIARENGMEKCPAVVHFSKFEIPFLLDLHARVSPGSGFPLAAVCTHEICRRLFPALPRRSMRAMAGYFGRPLADLRRCREHVQATALIWRESVRLIRRRHDIRTIDDLRQWLAQPWKSAGQIRVYPMPEKARVGLPDRPGVYRMLSARGDILYVGKANSLRQRVKSYFRKGSRHAEHILEMLSQARQLEVTATPSALEASILESDEIKRHNPPYNRVLRRDGRSVWFASPDLVSFSETPGAEHTVGPLASLNAVQSLAAIRQIVQTGGSCEADIKVAVAGLGMPVDQAPEIEIIVSGYAVFLGRYQTRLRSATPERFLFELGRELWILRRMEDATNIEEPAQFGLKSVTVRSMTPNVICSIIEANIARGTHEIRMARWLLLLAESAIGWEEHDGQRAKRFIIVLEKGQVLYCRDDSADELPVPPGHRSTLEARQYAFDLMTHDRLRVITTEIRKMAQRGRRVELRLGPRHVVDGEGFREIFTGL